MSSVENSTLTSKNYPLMTIILFWSGFVILISMYITIPLSAAITHTFHVTTTQAALVGSAFSFCYAIGCLTYGPFSDRYGRKIFLVAGIVALTVMTIVISFVTNFYALIILRAIQGLVAAAFAPISIVYAGEMFPPNKRITALGFISSGLLMASIAGQVFSGLVNEYFGWHTIFQILGVLYLITCILVIWLLPKDNLSSLEGNVFSKFLQMTILLKKKQLLLAYSITFMLLLSLVGMYTVLGSYLSSPHYGLSNQEIIAIRALGMIGMLFSPFAGQLAKRLGVIAVLRGGLALATIGLIAIGISFFLPLIIFMTVVFVTGIALVVPVILTHISQLAGNVRGSAISFNAFILFLGASIGPILAANLIKTENYVLSFEILGFILFIGFLVSFLIKVESLSSSPSDKINMEHSS